MFPSIKTKFTRAEKPEPVNFQILGKIFIGGVFGPPSAKLSTRVCIAGFLKVMQSATLESEKARTGRVNWSPITIRAITFSRDITKY